MGVRICGTIITDSALHEAANEVGRGGPRKVAARGRQYAVRGSAPALC